MNRLLPIDASTYVASELHGTTRVWPETNCYVDLWIEVLHALHKDPRAGLGFTLSADFEGEQWQFIKYPSEDLRAVYGLDVAELNPWRGLEYHVLEQLALGRLLTAEVDSWYLPDTAGVSYRTEHVKTSIVVNMIDVEARELGYFHGAGYYELAGEDFDGLLRRYQRDPEILAPYVERVRELEPVDDPVEVGVALAKAHFRRRPSCNPVAALSRRFDADLSWLPEGGVELFHQYAFATLRQCGATAELAGSLCEWLAEQRVDTGDARAHFNAVAESAKTMQFKLARIAAGRTVDHRAVFDSMCCEWQAAMDALGAEFGA